MPPGDSFNNNNDNNNSSNNNNNNNTSEIVDSSLSSKSTSFVVGRKERKKRNLQQKGIIEADNDNKYGKRRDQKRQRKMKLSILFLAFSLVLLGYTIWCVMSKEEGRGSNYIHKNDEHEHEHEHENNPINSGMSPRQRMMKDKKIEDERQARQEEEEEEDFRKQGKRHGGHGRNGRERGGRGRGRGRGGGGLHTAGEYLQEEEGQQHQTRRIISKRKLKHQEFPQYNDDEEEEDDEEEDEKKIVIDKEKRWEHLKEALVELNHRMESNIDTHIQWIDMSDVPTLHPGSSAADVKRKRELESSGGANDKKNVRGGRRGNTKNGRNREFFQIHRPKTEKMAWEKEYDAIVDKNFSARDTYIDYTKHKYEYPTKLMEPPSRLGDYPKLRTYKELMESWPQDEIDSPPDIIQEDLIHFDFTNPHDMEAALKFRDNKLPFKLTNVPELLAANKKWTDEYIATQFDVNHANGKAGESSDNFFAFFNAPLWDIETMGLPPTRDNDWTFAKWAKHSRYADRVGLNANLPHFYWQSGVPREERYKSEDSWSFVSKDLPTWSSSTKNFIVFEPESQKGIQCRFGERGITAANHYDSGRNMVGMISGAKRYILSPPRACGNLGIVNAHGHSSWRHSMLNYGHINYLNRDDMPHEEREWMEVASTAEAVSTVVKAGEVLYIPTSWFHYITSLQKSAQCNVRSGADAEGDAVFGGQADVTLKCKIPILE